MLGATPKNNNTLRIAIKGDDMIRSSVSGALCFALACTFGASATYVETASAQSGDRLEEVVVTARKREEALQDIPLAIAAFTADDIREAGIVDLQDITRQIPGVLYDVRGNNSGNNGRINSVVRIRGASVGSAFPNLQPTSVFVDGVFVLGGANSLPLSDLERVEVIKGPQSAFFGRNTFAGAVNYITKTPNLDEFETEVDMSAGQYEQYELSMLTSGPIIEGKLGYQINARTYNRGAMWTTLDGGGLGDESTNSVSAVLYAEPNDNLSIKLRYMYLKDDDGPAAEAYLRGEDYDTCTGRVYPGRYMTDGTPFTMDLSGRPVNGLPFDDGGPINYICGEPPPLGDPRARLSHETNTRPAVFGQSPLVFSFAGVGPGDPLLLENTLIRRLFIPGVPYLDRFGMERFNRRSSLTIDYTFNNDSTLSFLAGHNEQGVNFLRDYDKTESPAWYSVDPQYAEDTSFEIRYSSPQDKRLRWVAGATVYEQEFISSGAGGLLVAGCVDLPGSFVSFFGGQPTQCGPTTFAGQFALQATGGDEADVTGLFGSVSFDITEKLTIDAELRIMDDERTVTNAGFLLTAQNESEVPRVILSYKWNEDTLLYGQYSEGSLPGRVNGLVSTCSPDDFLVPYTNPQTGQQSTASECAQLAAQGAIPNSPTQELKAYEIGLKKTMLDGRMTLNAAAYFWEWDGKPASVSVTYFRDADNPADRDGIPNAAPNSLGANIAGNSEMYGLELETGFRFTDNWDASLNLAWSETEFTSFFIGGFVKLIGTTNVKGNEEPYYPNFMANFATTYQDQLNGEWDWFARADVIYSGDYWADYYNLGEGPSYVLTHLRAGVEKDDLRIELFVRNALDEDTWRTVSSGVDFSRNAVDFDFTAFQGMQMTPQDKRTIGIRANIKF